MDNDVLACDADLEAAVGGRAAGWTLKQITFLDEHCRTLLAVSSYAVGVVDAHGGLRTVGLGAPGAALTVIDSETFALPILGIEVVLDGHRWGCCA